MDNIRLVQWNARGIRANRLQMLNASWFHSTDIILQETWLTSTTPFILPGFTVYRQDRPDHTGGGLLTAVSNRYASAKIETPDITPKVELLRVEIWGSAAPLTILNVYVQHGRLTAEHMAVITDTLQPPFLLGGDWNARHPAWDPSATRPTPTGVVLFDWMITANCALLNTGLPTHFWGRGGSSVLDISFCSPDIFVNSTWLPDSDTLGSNHAPIQISLQVPGLAITPQRYRIHTFTDWRQVGQTISDAIPSDIHDLTLARFTSTIIHCQNQHTTTTIARRNSTCKWWTPKCSYLRAMRLARRLGDETWWREYLRLSACLRRELHQARRRWWDDLCRTGAATGSIYRTFRRFRSLNLDTEPSSGILQNAEGRLIAEPIQQAEELNAFFCRGYKGYVSSPSRNSSCLNMDSRF